MLDGKWLGMRLLEFFGAGYRKAKSFTVGVKAGGGYYSIRDIADDFMADVYCYNGFDKGGF